MSMNLIYLPDLPLQKIVDNLPVWKVLQLMKLCTRLYIISDRSLATRRCLRLFGASILDRALFSTESYSKLVSLGDFDLIIKFVSPAQQQQQEEGSPVVSVHSTVDPKFLVQFDHDFTVSTAHQIVQLGARFPNLRHFILAFDNDCPTECRVQLFANWPNLITFKVFQLDRQSVHSAEWNQLREKLNSKLQLENLELHASTVVNCGTHFRPLMQNGKLRSFSADHNRNHVWDMEDKIREPERNSYFGFDLPEFSEQLDRLDSFGLTRYYADSQVKCENPRFLAKFKNLQAFVFKLQTLSSWKWIYWTGLRNLHLALHRIQNFRSNFKNVLTQLAVIPNLRELTLTFGTCAEELTIPAEHILKRYWARLPTVRSFTLVAMVEPHHLPRLKLCFPGAVKLSLSLPIRYITQNKEPINPDTFLQHVLPTDFELCLDCQDSIKQTICEYGDNVESLCWLCRPMGGEEEDLVLKVRPYTVKFADRVRLNSRYFTIDSI